MIWKILNLAWLNLVQVFRNKGELVSIVVLPVALTVVFGLAFGGGVGADSIPVLITDEDGTEASAMVVDLVRGEASFSTEETNAMTAETQVAQGDYAAAVIVNKGFGAGLMGDGTPEITILSAPGSTHALAVREIVQGVAGRLSADAFAAQQAILAVASARESFGMLPSDITSGLEESFPYLYQDPSVEDLFAAADEYWEPEPPVGVRAESVTPAEVRGDKTTAQGYSQSSLGFTVMFVLFIALGSASGILEDREFGTLARMLTTPTSKGVILAGKIAGILSTTIIEAAILIVLGMVAFKVPWGQDPLALAMVMGSYILASTGLAVLMSALVRTRDQLAAGGPVVAVALAMLGGCYWPLDIVSPFMRRLADFTPTGWAMTGLVDIVARNQGVEAALLPSVVLLGFALVTFVLGLRFLRFE